MAPAAKRRKTNTVKYLCTSCDTERTSSQFPDYNPTSDCDHLINTCKACLKEWISANLSVGTFKKVSCPECSCVLTNEDVQRATTKKDWLKYDDRERRHIQDSTPNWRWCLKVDCRAGQVHERKAQPVLELKTRAKKKVTVHGECRDICICNECGFKACVPCDRPWHEGESCAAYQIRIKDRTKEEDLSLKAIGKMTKKCPSCEKNIQKNGGCPSMICTQCNVWFCWNCASTFSQDKGNRCQC